MLVKNVNKYYMNSTERNSQLVLGCLIYVLHSLCSSLSPPIPK